jgi:hypothetical protein
METISHYCRINEIKAYNDLSFVISGSALESDSYREEVRDATDAEREMWDLFDRQTPNFKEITVPKEFKLYEKRSFIKDSISPEEHTRWLENCIENTLWVNDGDIKALYKFENDSYCENQWTIKFYDFVLYPAI